MVAESEQELYGRERQVLGLLAEGLAYKEIARVLGIRVYTVKEYVARARARLGARTTAQAVALWTKRERPG